MAENGRWCHVPSAGRSGLGGSQGPGAAAPPCPWATSGQPGAQHSPLRAGAPRGGDPAWGRWDRVLPGARPQRGCDERGLYREPAREPPGAGLGGSATPGGPGTFPRRGGASSQRAPEASPVPRSRRGARAGGAEEPGLRLPGERGPLLQHPVCAQGSLCPRARSALPGELQRSSAAGTACGAALSVPAGAVALGQRQGQGQAQGQGRHRRAARPGCAGERRRSGTARCVALVSPLSRGTASGS